MFSSGGNDCPSIIGDFELEFLDWWEDYRSFCTFPQNAQCYLFSGGHGLVVRGALSVEQSAQVHSQHGNQCKGEVDKYLIWAQSLEVQNNQGWKQWVETGFDVTEALIENHSLPLQFAKQRFSRDDGLTGLWLCFLFSCTFSRSSVSNGLSAHSQQQWQCLSNLWKSAPLKVKGVPTADSDLTKTLIPVVFCVFFFFF